MLDISVHTTTHKWPDTKYVRTSTTDSAIHIDHTYIPPRVADDDTENIPSTVS